MRISTAQMQQLGVDSILNQQSKVSNTQQQLSTGKRILTPADDPAGAAKALTLQQSIDTLGQYNKNAQTATTWLQQEDSTLASATTLLQRVRDLAVQANNASTTPSDRRDIGQEVQQSLDQLVQIANTTNGTGDYLFGGYNTKSQPFSMDATGNVTYTGDQGQQYLQVSATGQVALNDSGANVFMNVPNGNGTYAVSANSANTGSGIISGVSVTNAATAFNQPYTISFSSSSGQLQYTVTDGGGATVSGPANFTPGGAISFGGRSVSISGQPAAGDSFTVGNSRNQSIFTTVGNFLNALQSSPTTTSFNNVANRTLNDLDQAMQNIDGVRASVGARLNSIDSTTGANSSSKLDLQKTLSGVQDLNYAQAISNLSLQMTGLQAAQQSFAKIENLSLFKYL